MKVGQYYQQGDVIIRKIDKLPEGLENQGDKILQYGETTGHMHQFSRDAAVNVFTTPGMAKEGGITINFGKYIEVKEPSILYHEEHKAFTVDPGLYAVDIVREFDYDSMEATRVRD